jgi:hypothetical protein
MMARPISFACALLFALAAGAAARGQEGAKSKDEALDSLLENLKDGKDGAGAAAKKAAKPAGEPQAKTRPGDGTAKKKAASPAATKPASGKAGAGVGKTAGGQTKPAPKTPGGGRIEAKDQAIDDLLGKLGETKDEQARDDRARNQDGGGGEPPAEKKPGEKDGPKLGGKDKEIDDRLEELAGRKRKRKRGDDGERSGPIGEMIKEMRDVEQRLGKPDAGESTQAKQKQIIKRIETMIEQVRQSGSSTGRLTMRMRQQQGKQPGEQEGDQTGALAQGVGPQKPAKPTSQHSTAGGKGVWGHLPDELRQAMENSFKEVGLDSKNEMIDRYFLSVDKGKLVREE